VATTVCLIRPNPPLFYFANELHRRNPLALVVVESRPQHPLARWWRQFRSAPKGQTKIEAARLPRRKVRASDAHDCERFFGTVWQYLDPSIPLLVVPDINAPIVRERLSALCPRVVIDHGTSIVKNELLAAVPLALNIHWGLSPYYRGTHCTEWALLNWDPFNIGVTLHKLTCEIDGGGVLAQARAVLEPHDTVHSINMQLTHLGTELAAAAVERVAAERTLSFHLQDHSQGLLTLNRQWSRPLANQICYLERQGLVAKMLKHPARRARLPIIEFDSLPEVRAQSKGPARRVDLVPKN
jgi:hypothetical protein